MSKAGEALYSVALKHLSKDGKLAGVEQRESQLSYIPAKQLRALIDALAAHAATVTFPAEPELRITAPTGNFVVQARGGKLHFVSWASSHKGGEYSADRIFAIVTGTEELASARHAPAEPETPRNKAVIALLLVAIVAVNSFTIWFVTRPKRTLLPSYTVMPAEPAQRVLEEVAGSYETGNAPGDRRLEIAKNGQVQRVKFGNDRAIALKRNFTVQPAQVSGKPALLLSSKPQTMITIKDAVSVVLYGDTYHRVAR
jgi:hypothetical protein